jgi:hypothetical protein
VEQVLMVAFFAEFPAAHRHLLQLEIIICMKMKPRP